MLAKIFIALLLVQFTVARKCSFQKDSKDEVKSVDCSEGCDFCRYIQIIDTVSGKAIDSQGCGCGIEHKTVVAGINDCLSESVAQGSRNVGKTTPIKIRYFNDVLDFSSPNYPNFYTNEGTRLVLHLEMEKDSERAYAFQFERFALAPNDCLYFCAINDSSLCLAKMDSLNATLVKKCGNEMDHRRPSHYYELSDTLYVFFVSQNTSVPYPGYNGRVFPIDKKAQIYNHCEKVNSVDLDHLSEWWSLASDHFFINTPTINYGTLNVSCQIKFTTADSTNIRVAIYAFSSSQPMFFTGIKANETDQTTFNLTGSKDPLAYYFKKDLTLSFDFTADQQYYYYLIVERYNETYSFDSCNNVGSFDMSTRSSVSLSALDDSYGYMNNSNCAWNFYNAPKNTQLMLQVTTYTERCCDILWVTGTAFDPLKFDGYYPWSLVYAAQNELKLSFLTDSIESYTQMSGSVTAVDCSCSNPQITLKPPESKNVTYGFNGTFPYCSPAQCSWTVKNERTTILQIDPNIQLLNADSLNVQNSWNAVLNVRANQRLFDSSDNLEIVFNSLAKFPTNRPDDVNAGMSLFLTSIQLRITTVQRDLCVDEFVDVHGDMLTQNFQAIVYEISTTSCKKSIIANFFDNPHGYSVNVYDGELITGTTLKWNNFADTSPMTISSNLITIRIVRLDGATSFHALFTTNPDIIIKSNPNTCFGATVSNNISIVSNQSQTIVIYQASGAVGGYFGMTFKPHGQLNYQMFYGASTKDEDRIFGNATQCDTSAANPPDFLFGQYVTLKFEGTQNGMIEHYCTNQSNSLWATAFTSEIGLVMSPKYLTSNDPSVKSYAFIIQYSGTSSKSIALDFLNKIPLNGKLTVITDVGKSQMGTT
ncbi:unnamed protein product, partial [Mesorhabditis belari]|uniref:CUB domain-containing protein n=1 Tax=Mesorhabditis belari TaxID=2138241 RepID=A0AAF3FDU8_9BILA